MTMHMRIYTLYYTNCMQNKNKHSCIHTYIYIYKIHLYVVGDKKETSLCMQDKQLGRMVHNVCVHIAERDQVGS